MSVLCANREKSIKHKILGREQLQKPEVNHSRKKIFKKEKLIKIFF